MSEGTKEELERQRARWWATVSSGDLDGYLALFHEDAVWVTPELDEIVGREAIRSWLAPVFAQFDYELTITVADVRVAGSLGIERARFVSRMTPKPPSTRPLPVTAPPPPAPEPRAAVEGEGPGVGDEPLVTPASDADEHEPRAGDEPSPAVETEHPAEDEGGTSGVDGAAGEADAGPVPDGGPDHVHVSEAASTSDEPEAAEPEVALEPDAEPEPEPEVEAPLVPGGPDAAEDEPHEGRYLMYWRWHDDAGWLVQRYADVTGVG